MSIVITGGRHGFGGLVAAGAGDRIVSYNILHNRRGVDGVLAEISKLKPDVVFLQEVEVERSFADDRGAGDAAGALSCE